jgi:hypothetical protein
LPVGQHGRIAGVHERHDSAEDRLGAESSGDSVPAGITVSSDPTNKLVGRWLIHGDGSFSARNAATSSRNFVNSCGSSRRMHFNPSERKANFKSRRTRFAAGIELGSARSVNTHVS